MNKALILPPVVDKYMGVFKKEGFQIYLVGGAVRNMLLKRSISNWDFATNATPQQIMRLFPESFYHNDYGTVTICEKTKEETLLFEVTPYRKESDYSDKRHPDTIVWAKTIQEDLSRRDFTINALAYDGRKIIDITNGIADLSEKIIRTVGDPDVRFNEDALRLMRAVRLATELQFLIDEKTRESMKKNAHLISQISWERISQEFLKILSSPHPAEGILFLRNSGILTHILPELDACFSIPQKSPHRHHMYDVGTHLVEALKHCPSKDPITRFATLIHDVGKASTYHKDEKTEIITFHNHEYVSAKHAKEIANRLKLSKEQKNKLITLVQYHMFTVSEKQTDSAIRRFIRNVGLENLEEALALRTGDRLGSGATPTSWRTELFKKRLLEVQKVPFQIKDLKIDGHDVMKICGIKPGPRVGKILSEIFKKVDEEGLENERNVLLKEIKHYC